jgi:recombinational DNA repair ATPase RecF
MRNKYLMTEQEKDKALAEWKRQLKDYAKDIMKGVEGG